MKNRPKKKVQASKSESRHSDRVRDNERVDTEEERTGRRERTRAGASTLKLTVDDLAAKLEGFRKLWVREENIREYLSAGYQIVEPDGVLIDEDSKLDDANMVKHKKGQTTLVLMAIKQAWHLEDMEARDAELDEIEQAIYRPDELADREDMYGTVDERQNAAIGVSRK